MTDTAEKAARPAKTRDEGQWALGSREPLNHNEVFKQEDDALNVRARIIDVYSKQGFDSITKDDLRGRFRWMGLYTQRRPGSSGNSEACCWGLPQPDNTSTPASSSTVRITSPATAGWAGRGSSPPARRCPGAATTRRACRPWARPCPSG